MKVNCELSSCECEELPGCSGSLEKLHTVKLESNVTLSCRVGTGSLSSFGAAVLPQVAVMDTLRPLHYWMGVLSKI